MARFFRSPILEDSTMDEYLLVVVGAVRGRIWANSHEEAHVMFQIKHQCKIGTHHVVRKEEEK